MGFPAEKKKPEADADVVDLSTDREQGLARNFEDPALGELISFGGDAPISIVEEAADAVHELVQEARAEPTELFEISSDAMPSPVTHEVRAAMGVKFFSLVACELPFPALVTAGLEILREALQAPAGSLLEYDPPHQDFFFRAAVGPAEAAKLQAFRIPSTSGVVGHVYGTRASLFIPDLTQDPRQIHAVGASVGFEAQSCLAAPLIVGGEVYGVVEFFHPVGGGSFHADQLALLEEGARMFAKVLEVRFLVAQLLKRGA